MASTRVQRLTTSTVLVISLGLLQAAMISASQQSADSGTGFLKTKVDPGRAGVFVDGRYLGPAANFRIGRKYSLPAGEHEVRLSEPRYEEVTRRVTIRAGETTVLAERLRAIPLAKPPFGRVRVVGFAKYDAVYVNGRLYGHADEFSNFAQGLLLNPGEYVVKIESPERTLHEEKVRVTTDQVVVVRAK